MIIVSLYKAGTSILDFPDVSTRLVFSKGSF